MWLLLHWEAFFPTLIKCSSPLPLVWHLSDCSHLLDWECAPRKNRSCLTPIVPVTACGQSGSKPGHSLSPGLMFSHFNKKGICFSDVLWPNQSWYHKMGWEVVVNSHWKVHLQGKTSWATHVYKEYRLLRISVFVHLGLGGRESGSPGHIPSEL